MAAAFLEGELQELLESKIIGSKTFTNPLFKFNGPLGSFSARIKLSFAFGLISSETLSDLDDIRKIRNDYAHKHQPINFETPALKKIILNLFHAKSAVERGADVRHVFISSVMGILGRIHWVQTNKAKFEQLIHGSASKSIREDAEISALVNEVISGGKKEQEQ